MNFEEVHLDPPPGSRPGLGPLLVHTRTVADHLAATARQSGGVATTEAGRDGTGYRFSAGARGLASLCAMPSASAWLSGSAVIELGCGQGLVSLAAASWGGARLVLATDADPALVALAARNLEAAGASACGGRTLAWGAATPQEADGVLATLFGLGGDVVPAPATPTAPLPSPFVILGADLLYYREGTALLVGAIASLLLSHRRRHPHAVGSAALLSFSPRYADWSGDLAAACAENDLRLGFVPPSGVLDARELSTGWYGSLRIAVLSLSTDLGVVGGWIGGGPESTLSLAELLLLEDGGWTDSNPAMLYPGLGNLPQEAGA